MRRTTSNKHQQKRQEILDAATRAILRAGIRGASISAICAEARISPGHLYHYFDSKEAIVEAITKAYLTGLQEHFRQLEDAESILAIVVSEIERTAEPSRAAGNLFFFELIVEAGRSKKIQKILQNTTTLIQSLLADLVRKGQSRGEIDPKHDPVDVASVIMNVIDAVKLIRSGGAYSDFDKTIRMMKTMVADFLVEGVDKASLKRRTP